MLAHHLEPAAYAMVRATYGTPEACTRTAYVQCVGPRGKLPSGAYGTQGADTRPGCGACQHGLEQGLGSDGGQLTVTLHANQQLPTEEEGGGQGG